MDDHTIVAGLGCHQGLEEDEVYLHLSEPQATSTVAPKTTREQLNRQFLQSIEEGSEGSLKEFRSLRSPLTDGSRTPHLSTGENRGSSGLGVLAALPLIDTEALSGLSSSNFLVEHTQLPAGARKDQEQLEEGSRSQHMSCLRSAALCEEEKHLGLNQGEVRDLLSYDAIKDETDGELTGLPSILLEPQGLLPDQDAQDAACGGVRDLMALPAHLARMEVQHDEFSVSQVQAGAGEISTCSTVPEGCHKALEASKLLSTSCSSLGSIEGPSDPFLTHQQKGEPLQEGWFEAHQGELLHMMEEEQFESPDLMFFEEEEKKWDEENKLCLDGAPASSRHNLDLSCFSGIHGVTEITVRPSWIGSPEKEMLGPDNRMLVDDYLQARSEALGALGASRDPFSRPNFGKEVHSPPTATRTQTAVGEESSMFEGSEFSLKEDISASSSLSASKLSDDPREHTLTSRGRQASATPAPATGQMRGETVVIDVAHEVKELEASVHAVGQPLEASTISSLLTRALATNAQHDLVDRILRLTGEPVVPSSSLEVTGLDNSVEVMELRQMKEDVVRQKQRESKPHHPGKENIGKDEGSKPTCIPNRKPLKNAVQPGQCPPPASPHTHMKLKAVRTSSDPGMPSQAGQEKSTSVLQETLQGAHYTSNLIDDTTKLVLPSFSQGVVAVKSSTPCIPRTQIPVPDSTRREPQRALPKMGLRSSAKTSGRMPEPEVAASGAGDEVDVRTAASWPTNVSSHPTTLISSALAKPSHHKDNLPQSHTNPTGVSVPQRVVLPEVCVVGVATYTSLPIHNTSHRWLQVTLSLVKETLDGSASTASVLLFQPSYILEPQSRCDVSLGVCCPVQGQLEAVLQVQAGELTASAAHGTSPSTHTVLVRASITMPKVEVQCEGGRDCVDFGVVGESCHLSHRVTLISHCPQPLPLLLHIHQGPGKASIFRWEEDKNKTGKVVSPSHLSCELTPSTPTTFFLSLRAPSLDGISAPQNGRLQVGSLLSVVLDSPAPAAATLASHPIKAAIGVVQLQILRTHEPLVVTANPHRVGTAQLTLKNASTFPLQISLSLKDDSQTFSLRPDSLTMSPGARSSPLLLFAPDARVGTVSSVLVLRVEPDGMEFKISVSGVCQDPSQTPSSVSAPGTTPASPAAAPPLAPVTAPAPASVPAPSALPAHQKVQKTHSSLTKSSSAPLSEAAASSPTLSEKSLSAALESTKARLVFGTVAVGATSCQKLVLRNTLTTQELPLTVTIIGSQAFQVFDSGSEYGREKLDVVLKPCEERVLTVMLQPSSVEPLSATLLSRHRSSSHPFKWQIPLQGYGGRGELVLKGNGAGRPFVLKDLALGLPAILQTSVTNTGHRTLFLALLVFSDKQCREPAPDLSVQPTRLVVSPGETQELYVVASGTSRQLARTPGLIGVLQAISGEEILRQRYQRMKNKEVKARRINNPDLLKLNWMGEFTGEQKAQQEPDMLPPQPEDAAVFFNACTIKQVEIWGEPQPNEDHSSTVFACLVGEQTVADLTTTQMERAGTSDFPPIQGNPNLLQPPSTASWDVLPQTMSVQCGDTSPQIVFVVNFTSTQQMLEVSSSCSWLKIEPREAVLQGHSSVKLCVAACPPHTLTSPVTHSLKVMGENESRSAVITVLPAVKEDCEMKVKSSQSSPASVASPLPVAPKEAPRIPHHTQIKAPHPTASTLHLTTTTTTTSSQSFAPGKSSQSPPCQLSSATSTTRCHTQGTASATAQPPLQSIKSQSTRESQRCLVQLVSDDMTFPDTQVTQETYVKMMLRNLDKVEHSVQAEVTHGPFMVRHTHFIIKSGHYVSVPVYFRPVKAGLCTGYLRLTVLKDKLVLPVHLSGRALP